MGTHKALFLFFLLASGAGWAGEQTGSAPRLLRSEDLPTEVKPEELQRQYDALATMSLRTIEYSSQGPIQDIDGDTGVDLPCRARVLKKGDSGADILQMYKDILLATGNESLEVRDNNFVDATTRNLTFSQSIRGIPVLFGVVSIEYDDVTGRVSGLAAIFLPDRNLPSSPKLSALQAEQIVPQSLEMAKVAGAKEVEITEGTYLGYFVNTTEPTPPSLAWVVHVTLNGGDREEFLVDAATGAILRRAPLDENLTEVTRVW